MLADETAGILARRARLLAKTRCVSRIKLRQSVGVEDLAAMEIDELHFGRRRQEQRAILDREHQVAELRKVAGRFDALAIDQKRRCYLGETGRGVALQEKIDERTVQSGAK